MRRPLAPRRTEALSVVPVVVTDLTAPAVVGLEGRAFRETVRTLNIPHRLIGKRMLVRVADFLGSLAPASADEGGEVAPAESRGADRILARIGRKRS